MSARIAFLGDVFLGGSAQRRLDEHGYDYALRAVRHLWADADLAVANLEAPLTSRRRRVDKADGDDRRFWCRSDPAAARALAAQGIGLVSLANNHVRDFGGDGVRDTMATLDRAGVRHCGAGTTDTAARRPAVVSVNGLRVGFLSVMQRYRMYVAEDGYAHRGNPGPALLRMSRLRTDVATLRAQVDESVVLAHWGRNYRPVTARQRRLARGMRAAGADLVVGHHPHVVQPVEVVDGVPVLYSLGNAAFGSRGRFGDGCPPYGMVAVVDLSPAGVTGLELRPILVDNAAVDYQPRPVEGAEAQAALALVQGPAARGLTRRPGAGA